MRETEVAMQASMRVAAEQPEAPGQQFACIARILGNDLAPRHKPGQTLENIVYLLEHEVAFEDCHKLWVINRITDEALVDELMARVAAHQHDCIHIPFMGDEYRAIGLRHYSDEQLRKHMAIRENCSRPSVVLGLAIALMQDKVRYAIGINQARNSALRHGGKKGRWVLPLDGNCLITRHGWQALRSRIQASSAAIHGMPMARAIENGNMEACEEWLDYDQEPQLVFRYDAGVTFDERYYYSRRDKVELLWRLGMAGPWERYRDSFFDPVRRQAGELASLYGGPAGRVIRLSSGTEQGTTTSDNRHVMRLQGVIDYLARLDEQCDVAADQRLDIRAFSERLAGLF